MPGFAGVGALARWRVGRPAFAVRIAVTRDTAVLFVRVEPAGSAIIAVSRVRSE